MNWTPQVLDVGCGDGLFLLGAAAARPERRHLGIDLLRPVIERAAREAERRGMSNLRFQAGDAVAWLRGAAPGSLEEIHIYHPQPYVDPAEVHLGMGTSAFFESAWKALKPDGLLVLQTDERRYGAYLLEAARRHFDVAVRAEPWPDGPRTSREQTARRKRLRILRVEARPREVPLDVESPTPYFDRPNVRRRRLKKQRP